MSKDMGSSFFRVLADPNQRTRWFLDDPLSPTGQAIDARLFTLGIRYEEVLPCSVPIANPGDVVNFNLAAFDMPVISEDITSIIQQYAREEVQCIPVVVDKNTSGFYIVNAVTRVKCIDENNSEIMRWKPEDGRPDKVGFYRMVTNLRIDPSACCDKHFFRIEGWEIALIVSKELKEAIESTAHLGVVFDPVTLQRG